MSKKLSGSIKNKSFTQSLLHCFTRLREASKRREAAAEAGEAGAAATRRVSDKRLILIIRRFSRKRYSS